VNGLRALFSPKLTTWSEKERKLDIRGLEMAGIGRSIPLPSDYNLRGRSFE